MIMRHTPWTALALAALLCCLNRYGRAQSPVQLTAEQDHQRMMDVLHIDSLRRGPDGDPTSANAANFDESRVGASAPPPDPLVLNDGAPVTSASLWWRRRRPEIVEAFDRDLYGRLPQRVPPVTWTVTSTSHEFNGAVPVVTRKLIGHVDNSADPLISVDIQLTLTVPADANGPVPVIMEFSLSDEALAALRMRFTEAQWVAFTGSGPPWQQQVLARRVRGLARDADCHQHPGRQRCRTDQRHHRTGEQGPTAQAR